MPNHGVFVRRRIEELAKEHEVVVVAPVPLHKCNKIPAVEYMRSQGHPPLELRRAGKVTRSQGNEILVYHPKYFITPKIFRSLYGFFMFISVLGFVKRLDKEHRFDLIDAHFVYPDGMAGILLGQALKKKVIVTARGSDINMHTKFKIRRKLIQWILRKADFIISVSESLKEEIIKLGIDKDKIKVIPNGVDIDILCEEPKIEKEKIILSAGNLLEAKGFQFLIEAVNLMLRKDVKLFILGEGPYRSKLENLIKRLKLEDRVKLSGARPHEEMHEWYSRVDLFCFTSSTEGRPNVVMEALACGCPVVSMNKWDLSSVVTPDMGILLGFYEPKVIAKAIEKALDRDWDRKKISERMKDFSWEKTASEVGGIFKSVAAKKDILFFSSDDWDSGLKTSKYHLAINLSKNHRVVFIESIGLRRPEMGKRDLGKVFHKLSKWSKGIRKIHENLYIYTPIVIPLHNNKIIRRLNTFLLKRQIGSIRKKMEMRNPIYWTFLPNTVDLLRDSKGQIVYYCVDNMAEFKGVNRYEIKKMDEELTKRADVVFSVSRRIYEVKKEINLNTYYMPHGVNYEHFANNGRRKPKELNEMKRPIIGFYGLISADWVDFKLVTRIVKSHPEWSIVMIGKIDADKENLPQDKNIHYLGPIDYTVLPDYARCFDVAMIPFNINELTKSCNPLKIYEYFAMGKPVVSVEIPEVRQLNGMTRIGRSHEEFVIKIEEALLEKDEALRINRMEFARNNTWERKVENIWNIVEKYT